MPRPPPLRAAFALLSTPLPKMAPPLPTRRRSTRSTRPTSLASPASPAPPPPPSTPPPAPKRRRRAAAPAADAMALPQPLTRCVLVRRYKRFLADVELPGGGVVTAHCPNPGSMRGMGLDERPEALVSAAPPGSARKLRFTLEALRADGGAWVGVNTVKPNAVVGAWLDAGGVEARGIFGEYAVVRREVKYGVDGGSRVDFMLEYPPGAPGEDPPAPYYVEVKSVTMSWDDDGGGDVQRVAVFPDSKTVRGQKHLRELADVVERGLGRACVLFFVNRSDAVAFAPCTVDPKYVALFDEARTAGVRCFPLAFELLHDVGNAAARFRFARALPAHPRAGP